MMIKVSNSPKRLKVKRKIMKLQEKPLNKDVNRMEQKLQTLRSQLRKKKAQRESNKQINVKTNQFLNHQNNTANLPSEDHEYKKVLESLRINQYAENLLTAGISKMEDLLALTDEKIDQLTDIPVGFRIKLKKFVRSSSIKSSPSKAKEEQANCEIEDIIDKRKRERKFVPLSKQIQEEEQFQVIEDKREDLMNSLFDFLHKNKQQNITKNEEKIYVEEKEKKWGKKYCWMCLKVGDKVIEEEKRAFCSIDCLVRFEQKMKVDNDLLEMNEQYQRSNVGVEQEIESVDLSII